MFVTPDELAHNKDGLLQFLIDQADEVQELYPEALTSMNKQRRMNDVAANNQDLMKEDRFMVMVVQLETI